MYLLRTTKKFETRKNEEKIATVGQCKYWGWEKIETGEAKILDKSVKMKWWPFFFVKAFVGSQVNQKWSDGFFAYKILFLVVNHGSSHLKKFKSELGHYGSTPSSEFHLV